MRIPAHDYEDPLDRIWLACARAVGLRVERKPGAYASTDGRGTLFIATPEELDRDDCLAQMILHELCHAAVEGPESFELEDWGLDNTSTGDEAREHACLRLQAFLLRPLGLGRVLAPTTDFRAFYDALGPDPFEGDDDSVRLGLQALAHIAAGPFAPHVQRALERSARLADALREVDAPSSSIWTVLEPRRAPHPSGGFLAPVGSRAARETCGTCAFREVAEGASRCVKAARPVAAEDAACERWEGSLECGSCGACCREGFDVLELSLDDAFVARHRRLVVLRDAAADLPRPGGRCPLLLGHGGESAYRCADYAARPAPCAEFESGGDACWLARRRVGLST